MEFEWGLFDLTFVMIGLILGWYGGQRAAVYIKAKIQARKYGRPPRQ